MRTLVPGNAAVRAPSSASRRVRTIGVALTALAWAGAGSGGLQAQSLPASGGVPGIGAGAAIEVYRFSDAGAVGIESLSLFTLPFAARADLSPRFSLSLAGAFARGVLSFDNGAEETLTGPTDTEVRATFVAGSDAVTITAIALLPTGHSSLAAGEAQIAGAVAADVLPFRVTNWGTGGGFGANVAAAVPVGSFSAGISAGYVVARKFEPLADDEAFVYRPGNQLHVTAALDRSVGVAGKFGLRASLLTFDADQANDVNLYQSGNRLQATASYAFASSSRSSTIVWAGVMHRDAGEFEGTLAISPARDLFFTGIGVRMPVGPGVIQPVADLRVLSGSDDVSRGYTAGVGATAELPMGSVTLAPTARLRIGRIEPAPSTSSSFVGADFGLVLRFGGR